MFFKKKRKGTDKIITILTIGISMASLLVFMIVRNYIQLRDTLVSNEQKYLLTIAETTAKNIENHFIAEKRSLSLLSQDSGFLKDFEKLKSQSKEYRGDAIKFYYKGAYPSIDSVQLLDSSGEVLAEHPSKVISSVYSDLSDLDDVRKVIRGSEFYISKVYFEGRTPFIYLLQPINVEGSLKGIVRSKMSIEHIYNDFAKDIKSGEKGYISAKTRDGIFIMHPKKNQIGYKVMDMRKKMLPDYDWKELEMLFEEQQSGSSGTKVYHSVWVQDDESKLIKKFNAYAPIKLSDNFLILTLSTDYNEVVERVRKNYYYTIVISCFIVFSFIFVGIYVYMIKEKKKKLMLKSKHVKELQILNTELEKDIEKRIKLEKELIKTMEEAKEKEHIMIHQSRHAAMGEMIGNIAHQWRQPLSTLSLLISNIEDIVYYGEEDEQYQKEVFERSRTIISKMSETIDDFRNFFRPRSKKESFTMERLLNLVIRINGERLKYHNILLEINSEERIETTGYFNQLCQVMLNLINNSIDALIEKKSSDRRIDIGVEMSEGENIIITIKDNGGGIPEGIIEKIFDPYFSTKEEKNGTGLGLHMSKMIIEKNFNGSIIAENVKDGVIFKLVIPTEGE